MTEAVDATFTPNLWPAASANPGSMGTVNTPVDAVGALTSAWSPEHVPFGKTATMGKTPPAATSTSIEIVRTMRPEFAGAATMTEQAVWLKLPSNTRNDDGAASA